VKLRKFSGPRLVKLRERNGWGQEQFVRELERQTGFHRTAQSVSLYEQGTRPPPYDFVAAAALVFGVTTDALSTCPGRAPKRKAKRS